MTPPAEPVIAWEVMLKRLSLVIALAAIATGCSVPCDDAIAKMQECFDGNPIPLQSSERCTEEEICAAECILDNSCSEVGAYISNNPNIEPGAGEVFGACYEACGSD